MVGIAQCRRHFGTARQFSQHFIARDPKQERNYKQEEFQKLGILLFLEVQMTMANELFSFWSRGRWQQ